MDIQFSKHHLLKWLSFSYWIVMVHNLFNRLLSLNCYNFVEDFCICSFLTIVFVWIWCWGSTGLIEWVRKRKSLCSGLFFFLIWKWLVLILNCFDGILQWKYLALGISYVGMGLISDLISLFVMQLLRFCVSSWLIFGSLCIFRNLSISSRLSTWLALQLLLVLS